MRDLQRRLSAAGFQAAGQPGQYGVATAAAVKAFQEARGLDATGCCDPTTWSALVEASWTLGDRHLYQRQPMLRGDDVAELQRRLGQLGFNPGRVDGIFGSDTECAIREFQRNAGLPLDGIFGHDTHRALDHLCRHRAPGVSVATVREREQLRGQTGALTGRRFALGSYGPLSVLLHDMATVLRHAGAETVLLVADDQSHQATAANAFDADAYLGVNLDMDAVAAYYSVAGFESVGGRRMAELIHDQLAGATTLRGMRLPILRETRMPAVLVSLQSAPPHTFPRLAEKLAAAVRQWTAPLEASTKA